MPQDTTNGQYIGLRRTTKEEDTMDTKEPAIDKRLEDTLNVVDSLRHIIFETCVFRDIKAEELVLLEAGEELFGDHPKSKDAVDEQKRALGAYLLLQALRKTPGAMDKALETLQARVVGHLRPDLLRVFDDAHTPPA